MSTALLGRRWSHRRRNPERHHLHVVPGVTPWSVELCSTRFGVEADVITGAMDVGITLDVEEPRQLGADRIVDCVAAIARYGAPAIIVDLGTATTLDIVDRTG